MANAEQSKKAAEAERFAAERRADYVRALKEEREGCVRQDKKERVKAIDAEIKRVESIKGRASSDDKVDASGDGKGDAKA